MSQGRPGNTPGGDALEERPAEAAGRAGILTADLDNSADPLTDRYGKRMTVEELFWDGKNRWKV
jgi:hypothetical protein